MFKQFDNSHYYGYTQEYFDQKIKNNSLAISCDNEKTLFCCLFSNSNRVNANNDSKQLKAKQNMFNKVFQQKTQNQLSFLQCQSKGLTSIPSSPTSKITSFTKLKTANNEIKTPTNKMFKFKKCNRDYESTQQNQQYHCNTQNYDENVGLQKKIQYSPNLFHKKFAKWKSNNKLQYNSCRYSPLSNTNTNTHREKTQRNEVQKIKYQSSASLKGIKLMSKTNSKKDLLFVQGQVQHQSFNAFYKNKQNSESNTTLTTNPNTVVNPHKNINMLKKKKSLTPKPKISSKQPALVGKKISKKQQNLKCARNLFADDENQNNIFNNNNAYYCKQNLNLNMNTPYLRSNDKNNEENLSCYPLYQPKLKSKKQELYLMSFQDKNDFEYQNQIKFTSSNKNFPLKPINLQTNRNLPSIKNFNQTHQKSQQQMQSKVIQRYNKNQILLNKPIINKSTKRINKLPISNANSQDVLNSFCRDSFENTSSILDHNFYNVNINSINSNNSIEKSPLNMYSGKLFQNKLCQKFRNQILINQYQSNNEQSHSPLKKTIKKQRQLVDKQFNKNQRQSFDQNNTYNNTNTNSKVRAFRQDARTVNSLWGSYINNEVKVDQSLIVMDFFNPSLEKIRDLGSQIELMQNNQKINQNKKTSQQGQSLNLFSQYIENKSKNQIF